MNDAIHVECVWFRGFPLSWWEDTAFTPFLNPSLLRLLLEYLHPYRWRGPPPPSGVPTPPVWSVFLCLHCKLPTADPPAVSKRLSKHIANPDTQEMFGISRNMPGYDSMIQVACRGVRTLFWQTKLLPEAEESKNQMKNQQRKRERLSGHHREPRAQPWKPRSFYDREKGFSQVI